MSLVPKAATITEEQKDQVVRLYRDGKKWSYIAAEVGIAQSNISWILEERGERRTRQLLARQSADKDDRIDWLEERIAELRDDNAALRQQLDLARNQVDLARHEVDLAMSMLRERRSREE